MRARHLEPAQAGIWILVGPRLLSLSRWTYFECAAPAWGPRILGPTHGPGIL